MLALFLSLFAFPADASRADDTTAVRQLVQMPLSVAKLNEAGVPADDLESLSSTLNKAKVSPSDFNLLLFNLPLFAEDLGSIAGVSNFTVMQHDRGLEGARLASAVKKELRLRGILGSAPLPADEKFVDDRVRKIIKAVKRRRRERRSRDEPPEAPKRDQGRQGQQPPPAPTGPTGPGGRGGFP